MSIFQTHSTATTASYGYTQLHGYITCVQLPFLLATNSVISASQEIPHGRYSPRHLPQRNYCQCTDQE